MRNTKIRLTNVTNENADQCSIAEEVPEFTVGTILEAEVDDDDGLAVVEIPGGKGYIHINPDEYEEVE